MPTHERSVLDESRNAIYSTDVLVGNWFEERFSQLTDKKAITPGIYGKSSCIEAPTLYQRDYRSQTTNIRKAASEYHEMKQLCFRNRLHGFNSSIKLYDSGKYLNNMTSLNDIVFGFLPCEARNIRVDPEKKMRKPVVTNLLNSFGNSKNIGLAAEIKCPKSEYSHLHRSVYREVFTPKHVIVDRKHRIHCPTSLT